MEVKQCTIKGKTFKYVVISRRSCFRAGVRYYMRGVDTEGHVANYVETEQILEHEGNRASFVQVFKELKVLYLEIVVEMIMNHLKVFFVFNLVILQLHILY